jgi:hypothetical protein
MKLLVGMETSQIRYAKAKTRVPCSWLRAFNLACPSIKLDGISVYQFFREIVKLGGFLGRKHDGEPG